MDGEPFWVLSRHVDISFAAADPAFSAQTGGNRAGGGTHLDDLVTGVHVGVLLPMTDDPRHELIAGVVRPAMHDVLAGGIERIISYPMIAGVIFGVLAQIGGRTATTALKRIG